ncbi:MAG: TRAP transporter small permease [Propioniciclava sp.]
MVTLNKIFTGVNRVVGWLLIALFAVMTVSYFGQVVLRYVFQTGIAWTEELTRYSQVALIMFGTAVLAGKNGNINVSVLEHVVPQRFEKWVVIGQQLITAAFFVVAIMISFDFIALAGSQVSTNMRIPMQWVYAIFPLAYTVLVFNVVVFIVNTITGHAAATPGTASDEAAV